MAQIKISFFTLIKLPLGSLFFLPSIKMARRWLVINIDCDGKSILKVAKVVGVFDN